VLFGLITLNPKTTSTTRKEAFFATEFRLSPA